MSLADEQTSSESSPAAPVRGPPECFSSTLSKSVMPAPCLKAAGGGVILGIDEAGRGPVLGPMVYGAAFWSSADDKAVSAMGFDDSKALSGAQRDALFDRIMQTEQVGWVLRVISAKELSAKMCRRKPYSLNAISHDAAIEMIQAVLEAGVNVTEVYVDTVGEPDMYRKKLEREFDGLDNQIKFVVAKKADSLYKTVSAASIVAKVTRDRVLSSWKWNEKNFEASRQYGSGYPSDARCVDWLKSNVDPLFGFPDLCRFSWGTTRDMLEANGARVDWEEEEDEDTAAATAGTQKIDNFMVRPKNKARTVFFKKKGLEIVDSFW